MNAGVKNIKMGQIGSGFGNMTMGREKPDEELAFKKGAFDWFKNQYGKAAGGGGGPGDYNPYQVSTAPTYTGQMTKEEINQSASDVNQGAASAIKRQGMQAAGQGYGTQSPITAMMQQMALGQAGGTNARQKSDITQAHAEANRKMLLDSQTSMRDSVAQARDASNDRRRVAQGPLSILAQVIGGIV